MSVSALHNETRQARGIYCGLLSEFARESGDVEKQCNQKDESSRILDKNEHLQSHYRGISATSSDDDWKFYQKGLFYIIIELRDDQVNLKDLYTSYGLSGS